MSDAVSLMSRIAKLERKFEDRPAEAQTCQVWIPDNGRDGPQPSVEVQLREHRNVIIVPRNEWPRRFPKLAPLVEGDDELVIIRA